MNFVRNLFSKKKKFNFQKKITKKKKPSNETNEATGQREKPKFAMTTPYLIDFFFLTTKKTKNLFSF